MPNPDVDVEDLPLVVQRQGEGTLLAAVRGVANHEGAVAVVCKNEVKSI